MKEWVKILLIVLFGIWLIPALKNTYLYFSYNHSNNSLIKIDNENKLLIGKWKGIFDYFPCGMDTREILTISFSNDSTGIYNSQIFGKRVVGSYPEPYSWTALFPFDENETYIESHNLNIKKNYFYYTKEYENHNSSEKHKETNYYIYKISQDSLYIDYWPEPEINNLPDAELSYRYFKKDTVISLWELINPIYLPSEYANLFNEIFKY